MLRICVGEQCLKTFVFQGFCHNHWSVTNHINDIDMSTNGVSVTLLVDHVIMLNHTIRFVLVVSLCCMAATTVNSQDPIFGNVVEGYVKDLFTKELSGSEQQNVTGCMARLLCENICQRAMNGEIKGQPLLQTAKMLGRTEEDPLG